MKHHETYWNWGALSAIVGFQKKHGAPHISRIKVPSVDSCREARLSVRWFWPSALHSAFHLTSENAPSNGGLHGANGQLRMFIPFCFKYVQILSGSWTWLWTFVQTSRMIRMRESLGCWFPPLKKRQGVFLSRTCHHWWVSSSNQTMSMENPARIIDVHWCSH